MKWFFRGFDKAIFYKIEMKTFLALTQMTHEKQMEVLSFWKEKSDL